MSEASEKINKLFDRAEAERFQEQILGVDDDAVLFRDATPLNFGGGVVGTIYSMFPELAAKNMRGEKIRVDVAQRRVHVTDRKRSIRGIIDVMGPMVKPIGIVETAPGVHDAYWCVADDVDIERARRFVARMIPNSADTPFDAGTPAALVPGFWNGKHRVRIVHYDPKAKPIDAKDVRAMEKWAAGFGMQADPKTGLVPLDQLVHPARINKPGILGQNYVWVVGLKRFVKRLDPTVQWDAQQFDSVFNTLAQKGSISKHLFGTVEPLKRYQSLCYVPAVELREIVGENYNVWRPGPIRPVQGDTTVWNAHIEYLFPDAAQRKRVLDWLAWVLQNPGIKPHYALLIIGKNTGTGKSYIARVMEQIIGEHNTQRPKNSSIGGDFNSWLERCKLGIIEEMNQIGKIERLAAIRDLITEPRVEVNKKNVPAFIIAPVLAIIGISNFPNALPIFETERRWLIEETKAEPNSAEYYARLFQMLPRENQQPSDDQKRMLGAIYYELLHRPLDGYIEARAPETEARRAMIEASADAWASYLISMRDMWPMTCRVVDPNSIVSWLPRHLQTKEAGVRVRDALSRYFGGEPWPHQIQPDGRDGIKRRVWLLGETAKKVERAKGKYTTKDVLKWYREDDGGRAVMAAAAASLQRGGTDDMGDFE